MGIQVQFGYAQLPKHFGFTAEDMVAFKVFGVEMQVGLNWVRFTRTTHFVDGKLWPCTSKHDYHQQHIVLPVSFASILTGQSPQAAYCAALVRDGFWQVLLYNSGGLTADDMLKAHVVPAILPPLDPKQVAEIALMVDEPVKDLASLKKSLEKLQGPFQATSTAATQAAAGVAGFQEAFEKVPIKVAAVPVNKPLSIAQGKKLFKVPMLKAQALGQKVMGVSQTSTYRVVAFGEGLRMAAKVEGGKLSLRVEGPLLADTTGLKGTVARIALADMGFKKPMHQADSYWSVHMAIGSVPPARVVGAVLMSMPAGVFQQQVLNATELEEVFA